MNFRQSPEFQKDLKALSKKWRSLPSDINDAQLLISDVYSVGEQSELVVQKFFNNKRAAKLVVQEDVEVIKMRLDVASIGRTDKVRIIFVAIKSADTITFVEMYAKNSKEREDPKRYKGYLA